MLLNSGNIHNFVTHQRAVDDVIIGAAEGVRVIHLAVGLLLLLFLVKYDLVLTS